MNTIELFCGTKSFSKVAKEKGYNTFTIDNNPIFEPDLLEHIDSFSDKIYTLMNKDSYDILWASPPCTAFSVASIGKHWTGGKNAYIPKDIIAKAGLEMLEVTIMFIKTNKPKLWYIENPRGIMRKVIDKIFQKYNITNYRRVTITYCQYGDTRMKPTDIWTNNFNWSPRKVCKNGDKCHISAPRGSKTGTQGLKGSIERSKVPSELIKEILE